MRYLPNNRHPFIDFIHDNDRQAYVANDDARWFNGVAPSIKSFEKLLARRSSEQKVQDFLEEHPFLLPGFGDLHHGPFGGVIVTKFPLGNDFITDFAFISSNSQELCITCVEIESPKKSLFRRDDKFHRDYFDARQQITDWLQWAQLHVRDAVAAWGKMFRRSPQSLDYKVSFQGYLVFGRRSDITNTVRQERWSAEASSLCPSLSVMTYDRLLEMRVPIWYQIDNTQIAVCSYRDRRFVAKRVVA